MNYFNHNIILFNEEYHNIRWRIINNFNYQTKFAA